MPFRWRRGPQNSTILRRREVIERASRAYETPNLLVPLEAACFGQDIRTPVSKPSSPKRQVVCEPIQILFELENYISAGRSQEAKVAGLVELVKNDRFSERATKVYPALNVSIARRTSSRTWSEPRLDIHNPYLATNPMNPIRTMSTTARNLRSYILQSSLGAVVEQSNTDQSSSAHKVESDSVLNVHEPISYGVQQDTLTGLNDPKDHSTYSEGTGESEERPLVPADTKITSPMPDNGTVDVPLDPRSFDLDFSKSSPSFQIPAEVLEQAIVSQSTAKPVVWNYAMYKNLGGKPPKRYYCTTLEQSERVAQLFLGEKLIGFDLEWKSVHLKGAKTTIKDNVSLIQLASEDSVALFHIALHRGETPDELLAPSIKRIMESPDIMKAGVAISGDCTRLRTNMGVTSQGLLELSHLHKLVTLSETQPHQVNRRLVKLADLVMEHLFLPMNKDMDVRTSDWSKNLSNEQIDYAASDAYAAVVLVRLLDAKRRALDPTPPWPYPAELGLDIRLASTPPRESSEYLPDATEDVVEDEPASQDNSIVEYPDLGRAATTLTASTDALSIDEDATDRLARTMDTTHLAVPPSNPSSQNPRTATEATQLLLANTWVSDHRTQPQATRATPSALRAYALWHQQALNVPSIAALLRTPPLQRATVAQYILEAIRVEGLPFAEARIEEVFGYVNPQLVRGRYAGVRKRVGWRPST